MEQRPGDGEREFVNEVHPISSCVDGKPSSTLQGTRPNTKKRQLPLWMLGVTGAESAGKHESLKGKQSKKAQEFNKISGDANGVPNEGIPIVEIGNKTSCLKRVTGKTPKDATSRRSKSVKTGKQIEKRDNSSTKDDDNMAEKGRKKTGVVLRSRLSRKGEPRTKQKKQHCDSDDLEDSISDVGDYFQNKLEGNGVEDELDLTVEDLLSMAKKHPQSRFLTSMPVASPLPPLTDLLKLMRAQCSSHIEAEKNNEIQCGGAGLEVVLQEPKKTTKKATSIFSNNEWRDLSHSLPCSELESSATEITSIDLCTSNLGREQSSGLMSQSERSASPSKLRMSDDIAQNMLDLLLGPSLGHTQIEDNKSQLLLENITSVSDITEPEGRTKDEIPLLKKKSSLRDKVTMLLN
eukprot:Gb_30633 [translate_table: standard]